MNTETEFKMLLKKFNKGVKGVRIEGGIVSVEVSSAKAAVGVKIDLLRSRGFSSVTTTKNEKDGQGFIVHAVAA